MESAEEYRAKARKHFDRSRESFDRCDTDGFVTQFASDLSGREAQRNAEIVEAGGTAKFRGLYERATGDRVRAKLIKGNYGMVWAFCDQLGNFTGRFIGDSKGGPRSRIFQLGYEVLWEDAPARAVVTGEGKGFSGLASCHVTTVRADEGYPDDAKVVR